MAAYGGVWGCPRGPLVPGRGPAPIGARGPGGISKSKPKLGEKASAGTYLRQGDGRSKEFESKCRGI